MPETISQRSHLANYFYDQNVCPAALNSCSLAALVGGADKNFLAGGAIDSSRLQQQRQQTESAHCSVLTASQYSCCAGGDVDSGCMRLQVTLEFCPPCIGSAKVLIFFFVFVFKAILVQKKEKKRKCGCLFQPKNIFTCSIH